MTREPADLMPGVSHVWGAAITAKRSEEL